MNYSELRDELRSIGRKIDELDYIIGNSEQYQTKIQANEYELITEFAKKYPLTDRGLESAPEAVRNSYLRILSYLALIGDDGRNDKLLYITRIAFGTGHGDYTAEMIYKMGAEISKKDFEDFSDYLSDYKELLIMDACIIVHISGKASDAELEVISWMAVLLNVSKDELTLVSAVSRGVLTDDYHCLENLPIPEEYPSCKKLRPFISENWIEDHRIFCGSYQKKDTNDSSYWFMSLLRDYKDVVWQIKMGSLVKKGQAMVSLQGWGKDNVDMKEICAAADGTAVFIDDDIKDGETGRMKTYINVYVISFFDDIPAFVRWYKKKNENGKSE